MIMRLIVSLCILSLVLVACGGDADPNGVSSDPVQDTSGATATPNDFEEQIANENSATEEVGADGNVVLVTPQTNVQQGEVPLPGTLAYDDEFESDNPDAVFDRIVFRRYAGGENALRYRIELYQDGTYELNRDILGQVDSEVVTQIDGILKELDFFAINTPMMGPGEDGQNYRYTITVERMGDELTINAEDGFIPQPFMRLIGALMAVIVDSPNTATTTDEADTGA